MIKEIAYSSKEEWLSLRKKYIGGSDSGAVVGLNPYKSAYALWAEKIGKIPEFEGNLTTEVGSYLEDFVAKLFERSTGKTVRRKNRMMVNDDYPWACADVDRVVVGENAIVEIKTTNSLPAIKKFKNGEYPESWYCQMTHYLAVGGYDKAYLAVLIECRDFQIFELDRDEDEIKALMQSEADFWQCVKTETPPMTDGTRATSEAIGLMYPESREDEGAVDLTSYESELQQYMALSAQIKELEELKEEKANRIKAFMGDSGKGDSGLYRVSYTSAERNTFDAKRYAKEHPDLDLSKYYKKSTYRTFRVAERG